MTTTEAEPPIASSLAAPAGAGHESQTAKDARRPLDALNFFMADMQAGVGPFLGVFLLAHGWESGLIGTAMTIGAIAGMVAVSPFGGLVDATRHKKWYIVIPGVASVLASAIVLLNQSFWAIAGSQVAACIAGAALGPAVAGLTLGVARHEGFNRRMGRNQAFNHAGNVAGAALSGYLGWKYGYPAVFWLAALFGVASIASVMMIPAHSIDDDAARGAAAKDGHPGASSGLRVLAECPPLLALAATMALFHFGNAAMLPLYGMAVSAAGHADPAALVATTIVVAQSVMIVAALVAMRFVEARGYWVVILVSLLALPLRALVASNLINDWGVYPVQVLDGVGAGLQSVAVPGLVARILQGTGRINLGQGVIMMMQGLGGALSPAFGGWVAQYSGYGSAFLSLGGISVLALCVWLVFRKTMLPTSGAPGAGSAPARA